MDYPKSTEEQPLYFFVEVFLKGEYDEMKKSFFREWQQTKENSKDIIEINTHQDYIIHYFDSDEENNSTQTKITFSDALEELVKQQCKNSKKLIKRGIGSFLLAQKSITLYLIEQTKILLTLSENNNYQSLEDTVVKLNSFVRNIIIIDVLGADYVQRFNSNDFFDEKLITVLEVLYYLNGTGDKQQKIMTDAEYKRLLFSTIQLVQTESVLEIYISFDKLNVTNELLRYTYYVLHVELFGIKPRRKFFTDFLQKIFVQLMGIDSFEDKFAQKPRRIPNYTSEIIKTHWRRKR